MNKESFIMFVEFAEVFSSLTDVQAGKLIKAIFEYEQTGNVPKLDKTLKIVFIPIKQALDKNREKYIKRCEKNKINGNKGGRPKNPIKPNGFFEKQTVIKKPDNDHEYDIDDDDIYINSIAKNAPENVKAEAMFYRDVINKLKKNNQVDILNNLTQDLLVKCWNRLKQYKTDDPKNYFIRMLENEVLNSG